LLTLLKIRQPRKPRERLNAKRPKEQGFSLAVVLVSMLAVLVSSVALANRTQTGLVTASVSGSNREAREVADAGVTYVISEWNRPENRGMYTALEPMTSWGVNNSALKNPCRTDLNPTASATSALSSPINLGEDGSNNRRFQVIEIIYRGANPGESFTVRPAVSLLPTAAFKPTEVTIVVNGTYLRGGAESTARASRTVTLRDQSCSAQESNGLFVYGGSDPRQTPDIGRTPRYYAQDPNANRIILRDVEFIKCMPIVPPESTPGPCATGRISGTSIDIEPVILSQAERSIRNPPSIADVASKAGVAVPQPPQVIDDRNRTVRGNESYCFSYNGAAHCNIASISLSGNRRLVVDTTNTPIYFYLSGNLSFGGSTGFSHVKGGESVIASRYANVKDFQDAVFDFQIRGNRAGGQAQTFSFQGTPGANLLFWAPTAQLSVGGSSEFSSALFVNSFSLGGSSTITLVDIPDSFISAANANLGGRGSTSSATAVNSVSNRFF
jgi:hypothetical protein